MGVCMREAERKREEGVSSTTTSWSQPLVGAVGLNRLYIVNYPFKYKRQDYLLSPLDQQATELIFF